MITRKAQEFRLLWSLPGFTNVEQTLQDISRKCNLPLPYNAVSFISRLGKIESDWNINARNGSHHGLFQFHIKRAKEHLKGGAYFVKGGFLETGKITSFGVSDYLYVPQIAFALALDEVIWANVDSFEEFYCLHILPGAYMLLESGQPIKIKRGLKLFDTYVLKAKQSREAKNVVKEGIRIILERVGYRNGTSY